MSETILVTGFGPFGEHKINASWESVKLLPSNIDQYSVCIQEIPVSYDIIESEIPRLWEKCKPKLVVHVGVSSFTDKILLETCAYRSGYEKEDCFGKKHTTRNACSSFSTSSENCIFCEIDVKKICKNVENSSLQICTSSNAGRYLCEYIFYKSLSIDKTKTMFIHVPPLGKPYTAQEIAEGILEIIKHALKEKLNKPII